MKYALGNMLNGAGGLNADQLALDLQFAADKTLTARKGPTPTFTRASSGTFVGSNGLVQTAGNNVARFDHDPVTLASRGLLIEESRTNLLFQSEDFSTAWSTNNLNTTGTPPYLNVSTAPSGGTTADKLISTTINSTHQFRQSVTLISGTSYTISSYFKAAETNFATISIVGVANGNVDWVAYFNISSSPAAGQFNGFASTSLTDVGGGWRRCSVTFAATASGALSVRLGGATSANLGSNFYAGDNTSGFFIWGAQLEAGSFATSYIPTTTSSVVRSADVCTISSTAFSTMWNTAEGTLFVSGDKTMSQNATGSYLSLQAGGTEVGPLMTRTSTTLIGRIRNGAGMDLTNTDTSQSPSGEKKVAVTWRATSDAADRDYASGGVILAKTNPNAGTAASNQTTLIIGGRPSTAWFNGTISAIRYYRKCLPNAKLASLTV